MDKDNEKDPWEWAEDTCDLCGAHIGFGVRFLHLGRCDECSEREGERNQV